MKFQKLTAEQVEIFISKLENGWVWNNGLVGNETLRFAEGQFISEFKDTREPEMGSHIRTFDKDAFRDFLAGRMYVEHVYGSLVKRLQE